MDVIALGEEDDYYVKLSSGKEYWNIPGKLADRCMQPPHECPKKLKRLGSLKAIHSHTTRLRGKHGDRTVAGVSLGYEDEYSVRFTGRGRRIE